MLAVEWMMLPEFKAAESLALLYEQLESITPCNSYSLCTFNSYHCSNVK